MSNIKTNGTIIGIMNSSITGIQNADSSTNQKLLPEQMLFPEELNKFLRDQIRSLKNENNNLRRTLEETETKLQSCSINKEMMANLTANKEMETLRIKCERLENNLHTKEAELNKFKLQLDISKIDCSLEDMTNDEIIVKIQKSIQERDISSNKEFQERIKSLMEKLQQTQIKLNESKNLCTSLRQKVNKAQKLLCREIGDDVTINGLANQSSGWRGRAEQISFLQKKLIELQAKSSDTENNRFPSSLEQKNLTNLRNTERERRHRMEDVTEKLRQAEIVIENYKKKQEASKARISILENELSSAKNNIAILNDKTSHDDRLIEALGNRLEMSELRCEECAIEQRGRESHIERKLVTLNQEHQALQIKIEQLRRKLEEREIELDKLRIASKESSKNSQGISLQSNSLGEIGEPNEYVTLTLAAEAERQRLLELIAVLNQRLNKERIDSVSLSESLHNERNKSTKLELKLKKLEGDRTSLTRLDSGYRTRSKISLRTNDEAVNVESINYKVELLEEQYLTLKTRLNTIQQEKNNDLAVYKEMLDQARRIFQENFKDKTQCVKATRSSVTI